MPAATRYGGSSLVNPTTAAAGLVPNPAGLTPRALHPSVWGALLITQRNRELTRYRWRKRALTPNLRSLHNYKSPREGVL